MALLDRTARTVESWGEPEHASVHLARMIAEIALIERLPETGDIAERVLWRTKGTIAGYSVRDFFLARFLPWRRVKIERRHPRYERETIRRVVVRNDPASIESLTLAGKLDEAEARIATDFDWMLYASTRAFAGEIEDALTLTERDPFPDSRRETVRTVCCIEAFHRGDQSVTESLLDELVRDADSTWTWLHLATGLFGRVPWGGYPFDDY